MPDPRPLTPEMARYDLSGGCDGESGRCLEQMVPASNGDYVLYAAAHAEIERLRKALARISSEHISYSGAVTSYDVGVTDGHRCAKKIADAALTAVEQARPEGR